MTALCNRLADSFPLYFLIKTELCPGTTWTPTHTQAE